MIRNILVIEDHPICASALTMTAQSLDSTLKVATVGTLAEARAMLARGEYAMATLDLALEDSEGLTNLTAVLLEQPKLPILVVSGQSDSRLPNRAAALGARGFLSKSAPVAEMKTAIEAILGGGRYFPDAAPDGGTQPADDQLSPAQTKVLIELSKGHANKIIAHELGLSEATIKSHLSAIYRVLNVSSRAQAILALQNSSIRPD